MGSTVAISLARPLTKSANEGPMLSLSEKCVLRRFLIDFRGVVSGCAGCAGCVDCTVGSAGDSALAEVNSPRRITFSEFFADTLNMLDWFNVNNLDINEATRRGRGL